MLLNQKFHKCKGSYLPLSKPRGGPVGGAQASPALITRALRCWFSLAPSRLCPEESTAWEEEADHQGHTWDRGEGSLVQFYRLRVQGHHHFGCNLFQALWFSAYSPCTYLSDVTPTLVLLQVALFFICLLLLDASIQRCRCSRSDLLRLVSSRIFLWILLAFLHRWSCHMWLNSFTSSIPVCANLLISLSLFHRPQSQVQCWEEPVVKHASPPPNYKKRHPAFRHGCDVSGKVFTVPFIRSRKSCLFCLLRILF